MLKIKNIVIVISQIGIISLFIYLILSIFDLWIDNETLTSSKLTCWIVFLFSLLTYIEYVLLTGLNWNIFKNTEHKCSCMKQKTHRHEDFSETATFVGEVDDRPFGAIND